MKCFYDIFLFMNPVYTFTVCPLLLTLLAYGSYVYSFAYYNSAVKEGACIPECQETLWNTFCFAQLK